MKILITGASGFVGGALWDACRQRGWEVLAVGRRQLDHPGYHSLDLSRGLYLSFRPDAVVHAAARSSPWGKRSDYLCQNVDATRHIIDFCERNGRPHLLYVSTSAVLYRNEHQLGLDESTPPPERLINEYARTKLMGEHLVSAYAGPSAILRPRAVFGPGDTVVFPRILRAAKAGRLPIIEADQPIWGDLIYIDALVDYIVRAIERRTTGLFHLTNNRPVVIADFLQAIFRSLDIPASRRRITARKAMRAASLVEGVYGLLPFLGEPPVTRFGVSVFAYSKTFNVAKCLRELGEPSLDLDEGVRRFIAWQKTQP